MEEGKNSFKVAFVGDDGVGKTTLIHVLETGYFSEYYYQVFEKHIVNIEYKGRKIKNKKHGIKTLISFSLVDTAGAEDYDRLRPLSYPDTDLFLLVFSIMDPASFLKIRNKYLPEVMKHIGDSYVPWILVGTKKDLENDKEAKKYLNYKNMKPVVQKEAIEFVKEKNGVCYISISSKEGNGIGELKDLFIDTLIENNKKHCPKKSLEKKNVILKWLGNIKKEFNKIKEEKLKKKEVKEQKKREWKLKVKGKI